jgi:hypothetical protein
MPIQIACAPSHVRHPRRGSGILLSSVTFTPERVTDRHIVSVLWISAARVMPNLSAIIRNWMGDDGKCAPFPYFSDTYGSQKLLPITNLYMFLYIASSALC